MPTEVIMPALGAGQETGVVVGWIKRDGESIEEGEPLMEIETDKATFEIEAPGSGTVAGISAEEGDEVPVGTVIAYILAEGEALPEPASLGPAAPALAPQPVDGDLASSVSSFRTAGVAASDPLSASVPGNPQSAGRASPKVRRMASERGITLTGILGSGPEGTIVEADLPAPVATDVDLTAPVWQAMAANLTASWQQIPHFYLIRTVVLHRLVAAKERSTASVTYTDLFVKLVARALRLHPVMNAGSDHVNVGLAIGTATGLLVPVIHDADRLDLEAIRSRRVELVERSKNGRMRGGDLSDATFTVSNLGMYGVDAFIAIVSEGQAGILAIGRIVDQLMPSTDGPQACPTVTLSLSCDHRRVDGLRAARFLDGLAQSIESPDAHL